jgi:hypothetical protein
MVSTGDQDAGRSNSIKTDNTSSSFERGEQCKYLSVTLANHYFIQEEITSKLQSRNAGDIWCKIFCLPVCSPKI